MFWAIIWMLFGALVGLSAANRKGFSPAAGVIGGLLLGIFSPLMYLVSPERKKCRYCAEWIKKEASICPHCQKDQTSDSFRKVMVCPSCHHEYPLETTTCSSCTRDLVEAVRQ